jgi:hypothetical protein
MPQGAVQFAKYQADRRRILAKANTCRVSEVTAAKTMIDRTADRFEVSPSRLAADTG